MMRSSGRAPQQGRPSRPSYGASLWPRPTSHPVIPLRRLVQNQLDTLFNGTCTPHQVSNAFTPDPTTGIDQSVLPYLPLWGPANPNLGVTSNGDVGFYSFTAPHVTTENFVTARLDHRISNADSLVGSYQCDAASATQPDPANDVLVANTTGRTYIAVEETHIISSQLINSARFGFNRSLHTSVGQSPINPLASNPALGESPGADNPQIDVPNYVSIQPGLNQIERFNFYQNSYQAYDDTFYTRGIHSLKMALLLKEFS